MEIVTEGIIFRLRPYSESSQIVQWLTRDHGRLSTMAKGARRPRSSFRGKLDLLYLDRISVALSRKSTLHTLREAELIDPHSRIRLNYGHLQQSAYCAKLVEQSTEAEAPIPAIFDLFRELLAAI